MEKQSKESEITKMVNDLDKYDTTNLMKWLIRESKTKELMEKTKPNKSTNADDIIMRNRLRM